MASEAYKRVRRKQIERQRRERIRNILAILFIIIVVLVAIIVKAYSSGNSSKTSGKVEKETTTIEEETTTKKKEEMTEQEETEIEKSDKFEEVVYPQISDSYKEINDANILSPYVALLDVNNNQIIAGRGYNDKIYPASMTKVMTLVVAVDNIDDFNKTFTMTEEIISPLYTAQASMAGFQPGEEVTANDLLYGLVLPSGADAAVALGMMVSGTEEEFVKLMNEKCEEIGLKNTHFTNTSGLYDENNYTTPMEMAVILEYAMTNEKCAEVLSTYQYTTKATKQNPEGLLLTSTMFSRMYGDEVESVKIVAGKTGYTDEAGSCLVSYATRGEDAYIAVTAKAAGRYKVIFDDFNLYGNYIPNPPGYTRY